MGNILICFPFCNFVCDIHLMNVTHKIAKRETNQNILSIPAIFLKHSYLFSRASPDVFVDREDEHEDEEESSAAIEVPKVVVVVEVKQLAWSIQVPGFCCRDIGVPC